MICNNMTYLAGFKAHAWLKTHLLFSNISVFPPIFFSLYFNIWVKAHPPLLTYNIFCNLILKLSSFNFWSALNYSLTVSSHSRHCNKLYIWCHRLIMCWKSPKVNNLQYSPPKMMFSTGFFKISWSTICYGCSHFGFRTSLVHDAVSIKVRNKMEARERWPHLFLTFTMENHTLWTYLTIRLIEIDTYDLYIGHCSADKNTIINWCVLFSNKSQDECTNFCPDVLVIFFCTNDSFKSEIWWKISNLVCSKLQIVSGILKLVLD